MPKTKVEVYDKDQLIYPFIESDHVTFSNGMKVTEMLDQSISMPTVTHEDLSFKVGVGDQDVSSAIVDSSVSEMTIKGKTYQNILPEPSTHVLTNNKEMFKVNEGLDSNVEIVDGVSKSAILKGHTLVNIRGKAVSTQANFIDYEVYGLQNNTTYTIVVESTDTNVISVVGFLKDTGNWNCQTTPRTQNCKVVLTTTSAELMGRVRVRKDNKQDTSQAIQIRVMVLEGDYSNVDIPHFEGMTSCKMPVLKTTGKNLFDSSTEIVTGQGINSTNGLPYNISSHSCTGFLRVKSNTTYTITQSHNKTWVFAYNKNKEYIKVVKTDILSGGNFTTPNDTYYIRLDFNTANTSEIVNGVQIEQGTVATSYEPYKTNILSTPEEVVLRSLPNGVKDTLNLNTGEYVQRIGEITFNGSESWQESGYVAPNHYCAFARVQGSKNALSYNIVCNSLPVRNILSATIDYEGCMFNEWSSGDRANVIVKIANSKLSSTSVEGVKAYLQSNPLTVQYELATPVVKTVDLSSSGNWEKVVLDGSEDWQRHGNYGTVTRFNLVVSNIMAGYSHVFSDALPKGVIGTNDLECINNHGLVNQFQLQIKTSRLLSDSVDGLKQYLSQNPITVWYQTATHQDSTQVKQPIFFKDGHIQLSSGADHSLIPTLDYQAKTSNSYVMDLMKTNTRYTMKAKSASGTFTIDGTSYGAGTNGTFTTPSSMTNKLLVMSNKTNEEVMILEGDVVSKTIPYFKGIKSAFEDESQIEVLSTGRNLCPPQPEVEGHYVRYQNGTYVQHDSYNVSKPIRVIEGHRYRLINTNRHHAYYDKNMNYVTTPLLGASDVDFYSIAPKNAVYLRVSMMKGLEAVVNTDGAKGEYREPNSTKIPLLSPLRSLPNGVCDEIILDRENNKATLIQRVGELIHYGQGGTVTVETKGEYHKYGFYGLIKPKQNSYSYNSVLMCDTFMWNDNMAESQGEKISSYKHSTGTELRYAVSPHKTPLLTESYFRDWLSQNPVTVYYELETPVITEVDLEGFPYIYKDGHIFLNSEIVPTTEITYSINQCQQISASNEDIIRHEKELTYLQKLIAQYIQVDYESVLLSLKV